MACTIAMNGALRSRWQDGPVVPLPGELQPAFRKAGTCQRTGSPSPMTSRTRDQGQIDGLRKLSLGSCSCSEYTNIAFWRRTPLPNLREVKC